ncbi:hypothetical protein [Amycolatopsis benzoatilytica]|uniref:hypothetical protein n=1 Tax=Amycolatopsis benzoatilytica TaxID=346045 RepID=UPI00037423D2|nr:hypothetical protein [Amycolatopsis benzoatilytica]
MSSIKVSTEQLHQYAATLEGLHEKISKIDDYMKSTACDKTGFTGLFIVLQPVVDLVSNLYGETLKFGHSRLTSLTEGVKQAAEAYTNHDANSAKLLEKFIAEFEGIDSGSSGR